MKPKTLRLIFTLVILIVAVIPLIFSDRSEPKYMGLQKVLPNVKLGLDIQGGSLLEYSLKVEGTNLKPQEVIDNVVYVLRKRLDAAGYNEATVAKVVSGGEIRVRVEIPGILDTTQAEKLVGSRGKLYFAEVVDTTVSDIKPELSRNRFITVNGQEVGIYEYVQDMNDKLSWYRVKKVFEFGKEPFEVNGSDIIDARASINTQKGGFLVNLRFSSEGAKKFELATGNLVNKRLAIVLDDKVIIAPNVNSRISGGEAVIENIQTIEEAQNSAALIKSGNMPVDLVKFQENTLGPTLGKDIVETVVFAGLLGCGIVLVIIVLLYGWTGIVADIALIYNIVLIIGYMALTKSILTLPGIAGVILAFGTGIDGNVIINERIKEELRLGRPVLTAVGKAFDVSFWAIFDANITSIISCIVLYYFSTGTIRGFAITTIIGLIGSMFTNLVVSRLMLESSYKLINVKKYYKGNVPEVKEAK
ncbi:MAG TPA: protein translocase subunit SecD [Petrotogaceae bacterium]|nr:protein translocase subunit SecD [Petrotogaceae bacterium]HNY37262.1 protein translocase subunit SecD [Petrotogaceae bacterium]HOG34482.1 protein translocase subunit SecD [Petrotogaceae bacterium]HPX16179.1 protein translocase subunit SecD [Petrotogaceae bacterium]HQC41173.1 protein translocase subunit SecD [Petrotogaceae bacterium]